LSVGIVARSAPGSRMGSANATAGADAYERELLDAFDAAPQPLGRYLDAEREQDAA